MREYLTSRTVLLNAVKNAFPIQLQLPRQKRGRRAPATAPLLTFEHDPDHRSYSPLEVTCALRLPPTKGDERGAPVVRVTFTLAPTKSGGEVSAQLGAKGFSLSSPKQREVFGGALSDALAAAAEKR